MIDFILSCAVKHDVDLSPQLRSHFHGDAEVPQKLLQYAWTHWEDSVDVNHT